MDKRDQLVSDICDIMEKIKSINNSLYGTYYNEFNRIPLNSIEQYLKDLQSFKTKIQRALNNL